MTSATIRADLERTLSRLREAGIPTPIYGPSGGSYGEDYVNIDEMVLCSQVLALTARDICG